jgi:hypothetical protein
MGFDKAGWEEEYLVMCEEAWGRINGWEAAYLKLCREAWERISAAETKRWEDRLKVCEDVEHIRVAAAASAMQWQDCSLAEAMAVIDRQLKDDESDSIQANEVHCLMMQLSIEHSVPDWN